MGRQYALTDDQWECIKDLLPAHPAHVDATARNNRLFIDAVLYRYLVGIPWCDLPKQFADFPVVHLRYSRWSIVWHVGAHLQDTVARPRQRDLASENNSS